MNKVFDKENIEKWLKEKSIDYRFWGRSGEDVAQELESQLKMKFSPEVKAFITEIGNLGLDHYDIILTGDEEAICTCFTESEDMGLLNEDCPIKGVQIMNMAGLSYVLLEEGSIKAYEFHDINPGSEIYSFKSLEEMIKSLASDIVED